MAYCNLDKAFFEGIGKYDIPIIEPFNDEIKVKRWLSFNYCKKMKYCDKNTGCFFYIDDYQFETLWNHPNKYIDNLKTCGAVVSPDFSLYSDFPKAIQIYNLYRNMWLTKFYQNKGVKIIPNVSWSLPEHYDWQFEIYSKNSIVSISSAGAFGNKESKELFYQGYNEMIRRLSPNKIFVFSLNKDPQKMELDGNVEYVTVKRF